MTTEFSNAQKTYLETLFLQLNIKIDNKITELKGEITQKIETVSLDVTAKFNVLDNKIKTLEEDNKQLNKTITTLERKVRKNNIAIFGINSSDEDLMKCVCDIFNNCLKIQVTKEDINDIYHVDNGKNNKPPVIVEFTSYQTTVKVLRNAKLLKGKNIFITKDQCLEDQLRRKSLIKHLKEERRNGVPAYIKGNKLYISNEPFNIEQLEERRIELSMGRGEELSRVVEVIEDDILPSQEAVDIEVTGDKKKTKIKQQHTKSRTYPTRKN